MDALTTAALAEALGGVTADAVTPLLRRAARAATGRSRASRPDFPEIYRTMLRARSYDVPVLSLYQSVPEGITLSAIKHALNSGPALGFIRQLAAIHIITDLGAARAEELRDLNRARTYSTFRDYLAEALHITYSLTNGPSRDSFLIYVAPEEFESFAGATIGLLDQYSRMVVECLTRHSRDTGLVISWAQSVQTQSILESIERYAALAVGVRASSSVDRTKWIDTYRAAFLSRHQSIPLPDLDRRIMVPHEDLYVEPRIQSEDESPLSLQSLTKKIDRVVILGDPGAGKSTTSTAIALNFVRSQEFVPFYLTMREIDFTSSGFSVVQIIEDRLASHYQVLPAPGLVEQLLTAGFGALIFDGLDELLDSSVRRQASSVIEVIADRYPLAPVIVTCRRVGYSQAQLDPHIFEQVGIEKFDDVRVRSYAKKWFTVSGGFAPSYSGQPASAVRSVEEYVVDFMDSSSSFREMTSNPLLLSFICILYRGRGSIPRNRPQLFEKCVDLLLRAWDTSRGVTQVVADDSYELALAEVADTMVSGEEFQAGIPGIALRQIFANHLMLDASYPPAKARRDAAVMVEHCKDRAWIFCDVGLPGDDDHRYAFTHSSFMEYFYAWSLTRRITDPRLLAEELYDLLRTGRSQVAVQVAIHLCNRNTKGGGSICVGVLAEKMSALSMQPGPELTGMLDVLFEASSAIPLNVDAVFVLCKAMVSQIVSPLSRPGSDLLEVFSADGRHVSAIAMVYPKVLRSLIGYQDELAQLRLCWLFTEAVTYLPSGSDWDTSLLAITRIQNSAEDFSALLKKAKSRRFDLAWSLALRRGFLEASEVSYYDGKDLLTRFFEPCTDSICRIGYDMNAAWLIANTSSGRSRLIDTKKCRDLLAILGQLLLGELRLHSRLAGLMMPQEWIDHIREVGIDLLASGSFSRSLDAIASYDKEAKLGFAFLAMASLDAFVELIPSDKPVSKSSSDSYEEAFQVVYQKLLSFSAELPVEFRRYLASWSCGQIWRPEWDPQVEVS